MKLTKEQERLLAVKDMELHHIERQIAILTGEPMPKRNPAPAPSPKQPEKKITKTFKELRANMQKWNRKFETAATERDETIAYYKKIGYGGQILEDTISEANAAYNAIAIEQKKELKKEIAELRAAKLEQLKISVTKAPTPEQALTLDNLHRRTSFDKSELQMIAESMGDSYGALRALGDIAESKGLYLAMPDHTEIAEKINAACDYAEKMLDCNRVMWEGQTTAFFGPYDEGPGWRGLTRGLDDDNFSIIPEIEQRVLKDNETALLDRLFGSVQSLDLAKEVNQAAQSKEMRTLIELHPEYSALLEPSKESGNNG